MAARLVLESLFHCSFRGSKKLWASAYPLNRPFGTKAHISIRLGGKVELPNSIQDLFPLTRSTNKFDAIEVVLGGRVSKLRSAVYVVSVVFQNVFICRPKDLMFL